MPGLIRFALVVAVLVLGGCSARPGPTFEPGVEQLPGPGYFLIRIVPAVAIDTRRIALAGDGHKTVLFLSHRRDDRFLSGTNLPSTLRAQVDGRECVGSIEIATDIEFDGTLTIKSDGCELRLDSNIVPVQSTTSSRRMAPWRLEIRQPGRKTISATIVTSSASSISARARARGLVSSQTTRARERPDDR